ncbi:MAG: hypothetical protein R8K20_06225 [Gallionellaceae bacterium]
MIVTEKFAFIHLQKTGGTFVNEFIQRFFPEQQSIGYHFPRRTLPASHRGLPVLGFVRNPWGFYVSWYVFQLHSEQPNSLFLIVSENKTLDFNATIGKLLTLCDDDSLLDEVLATLPQHFVGSGLNLPRAALAAIRGSGLGFYGLLYQWMFTGEGPLYVGKLESLAEDLLCFLVQSQCTISPAMRQYLQQENPRNATRHQHYRSYYDEALKQRVAQLEDGLIERYQYRF